MGYQERAVIYDIECTESVDHGFLVDLAASQGGRVLEIPCGAGRNSMVLARSGREITAVDIEPRMIHMVEQRIREAGVGNVRPVVGDMRNLDLPERFSLIVVAREAFQFLLSDEEILRALRSLARHLAVQGRLVIDMSPFWNARPLAKLDYYDPGLPDGLEVREWTRGLPLGSHLTRFRTQYHEADQVVRIKLRYETEEEPPGCGVWEARFRVHSREGFDRFIRRAGLLIEAIYGDYDYLPYYAGACRLLYFLKNPG